MRLTASQWMEFVFNICYLVGIYALVILMTRRLRSLEDPKRLLARFRDAFLLLAIGDTGHVGFRVIAYARGGLEDNAVLVGLGALATAITVTFLYAILIDIWRLRFDRRRGLAYWTLMAVAAARLVVMCFPQNRWGSVVPPFAWSLARNVPLTVVGIGVAVLLLVDSLKRRDTAFVLMSAMIFASFEFYAPVILFVSSNPWVGMLMIPKTLAYIAMAWIGLARPFKSGSPNAGALPET
jgi:hypothetical protein